MREIDKIIVHCSATKTSSDIGTEEIRKWHVNGNGWSDIGYHKVIRRDGSIESGRDVEISGAHCRGQNSNSIGICLIGGVNADMNPEFNYTVEQMGSLRRLIVEYMKEHPKATLHGHNEFSPKACPCFDVMAWWKS